MTSLSKFFKERQYSQLAALLLLVLLLLIGAVPGYLTGNWQWKQPPPVPTLKELREIRKAGLSVPGWQTIKQEEREIGERKWSLQTIQKEGTNTEAILLILPQNGPMDQPQVEWMEVDSFWHWDVAQLRDAEFTVKVDKASGANTDSKVKARFFRGSTKQQTFAVLQWYAWSKGGGNPSQLNWFLADQSAQWHKQRAAWAAVSIMIPMEPLGQVEKSWEEAKSLGETLQLRLLSGIL